MEMTLPFARLQLQRNQDYDIRSCESMFDSVIGCISSTTAHSDRGLAIWGSQLQKMDANNRYKNELDFAGLAVEDPDFAKVYVNN